MEESEGGKRIGADGRDRLPFTCAYLGSIVITLWAAIGVSFSAPPFAIFSSRIIRVRF